MHFNRIEELPILETERLLLRPFQLEDVHEWFVLNQDPEITRYTGDGGVVTESEMERRIREHVLGDYEKYGFGRWIVIHKKDNCIIGFTGLKFLPDMNEVDLGYRFAPKYWRKGIATEASFAALDFGFNELGLQRIVAFILPENIGSQKVLEKLGFQFVREFYEEGELEHVYELTKAAYLVR